MDKIIYTIVYNRKKKLNQKGMALVQVEAYLNRKKKYFSTKVYLKPEQWDAKKLMVKNHPNAAALNRLIYEYLSFIEKKELELWQQGKHISLDLLRDAVERQDSSMTFTSFYQYEADNSGMKLSTRKNHLSTLTILQTFKKEISFSDLTYDFISSFEHFMHAKGYHVNTIAKHMKHLKRYINIAINKDYMQMQQYPFRKYRIKTIECSHTHLAPHELELLEQLNAGGRCLKYRQTLDAFLFCCYAGLRYSDFVNLKSENVVQIKNNLWLIYRTVKTGTEVRLPLYLLFDGKWLDILKKYEGRLDAFFRLRNNSNINKELVIIARMAGLAKHISFHSARHTNATLLIYNGVNITTVQKLLGHKSIRTTQVYANIMDMTVVHDLEKSNKTISEVVSETNPLNIR